MSEIDVNELVERVKNGYAVTPTEALALTQVEPQESIVNGANAIRQHFCGNEMDLCSIINARSGLCSEDCKWCSQSKHHNAHVQEYEMVDPAEAVALAVSNRNRGVKRFSLVTSGRTVSNIQLDKLVGVYQQIRQATDISLCASMGLLSQPQLQKLKDNGITHYHCNIETAPSFFPSLCSTHTLAEKVQTIKWAKELGMRVCSGGIIGMGESMEQRVEMAVFLRELGIESIPINILMPIEGTPLEGATPLSENEIIATIAMFRFVNPQAHIRFAGGRQCIKGKQEVALRAGVNAALVGDYLTTIGSTSIEEDRAAFTAAGFDC